MTERESTFITCELRATFAVGKTQRIVQRTAKTRPSTIANDIATRFTSSELSIGPALG